jgi:hypothetical protein
MALPATDNFNRANGPLGANWSDAPGWPDGWDIWNNYAIGTEGVLNASIWTADTPNANHYSQGKYLFLYIAGGLAVRVPTSSSTKNGYYLGVSSTAIRCNKIVANTESQVGSDFSRTNLTTEVFRFEANGTTLSVYVDDVFVTSWEDSDLSGGTFGLCGWATNTYIDDWEGGNVASSSAAVTGTATASITGGDVVTGGKVLTITLTGETFIA